jgi:hypothetical protein
MGAATVDLTERVADLFQKQGIEKKDESCGTYFFEDDLFRYRIRTKVEIGIRKHFDRWANSVDYELAFLPKDEKGVRALVLAAKDAFDKKQYSENWGQRLDLYNGYRRFRRKIH